MRMTLAALAVAALALTGCGAGDENDAAVTSTPSVTSTSATTSATSSTPPTSSTTEEPPAEQTVEQPAQPPAVQPAPVQQPAAPSFVRCEMFNGTALMSDGTTTYLESCDENAGGMVPGNVPPTYSAEEEARKQEIWDWYNACVEQHGIDYCVEELNS